jgi:hypothetical protein
MESLKRSFSEALMEVDMNQHWRIPDSDSPRKQLKGKSEKGFRSINTSSPNLRKRRIDINDSSDDESGIMFPSSSRKKSRVQEVEDLDYEFGKKLSFEPYFTSGTDYSKALVLRKKGTRTTEPRCYVSQSLTVEDVTNAVPIPISLSSLAIPCTISPEEGQMVKWSRDHDQAPLYSVEECKDHDSATDSLFMDIIEVFD